MQSQNLSKAKDIFETALKNGDKPNAFILMNLGHVYYCSQQKEQAMTTYIQSRDLFKDKEMFFSGMEDDWQYLEQYGVNKEDYDFVIEQLKTA